MIHFKPNIFTSLANENVDLSIYQEIKANKNKQHQRQEKRKPLSRKISDRVIRVFVTNPNNHGQKEFRHTNNNNKNRYVPSQDFNQNVNFRKKITPPNSTRHQSDQDRHIDIHTDDINSDIRAVPHGNYQQHTSISTKNISRISLHDEEEFREEVYSKEKKISRKSNLHVDDEDDDEEEDDYQIKPQHTFVPPPPPPPAIPLQPPPSIRQPPGNILSRTSLPYQLPPPPLPNSFLNAHTQVSPAASFSLSDKDNTSESAILYAVQPQSSLNNASIRHHSVISVNSNNNNNNNNANTSQSASSFNHKSSHSNHQPIESPLYEEESEEANKHVSLTGENDNFLEVVYVDQNGSENGLNIGKQTNVLY